MKNRQPIAITTGDHRGIGPEVISKGLFRLKNNFQPHSFVIFGKSSLYKPFRKYLPKKQATWTEKEFLDPHWKEKKNTLNFIEVDAERFSSEADVQDAYSAGRYIELAIQGTLQKKFSAICTGPIDKTELHRAGFHYDGHTEMLRALCGVPSVTMMLANPKMRVSLVTVHVALKDVSERLSSGLILQCIENTIIGLRDLYGTKKPRLAILGLNPHASDKGLFGNEEKTKIEPAIEVAKTKFREARIEGPFAPDGFFAQWGTRHIKNFDAIICMYHDQGLVPVKLLDFKNTVNITLGLPIIRTSVDHGVGLDIAGRNLADPSSFVAALNLAKKMAQRKG